MAEKKERNALNYNYIYKVLSEHGTPAQQKAFVKVAYGYCKTITVPSKKDASKMVRAFEWVRDEKEIAAMKAEGKKASYNKKAAEEWFKANMADYVPQPKEKLNTRSMLEKWGD